MTEAERKIARRLIDEATRDRLVRTRTLRIPGMAGAGGSSRKWRAGAGAGVGGTVPLLSTSPTGIVNSWVHWGGKELQEKP